MKTPSESQIYRLLAELNPWWEGGDPRFHALPKRAYFAPFQRLATDLNVHRAIVLLGSRRVGKTVMLHQLIGTLLESGTRADHILYASIEQPLLLNYSLAELVDLHLARLGKSNSTVYILLDEIQYQREWDIQLKALVDLRPSLRFIVTGSAGAALSSGSRESGAGRFSNFYLPALLFHEYLQLSQNTDYLEPDTQDESAVSALNELFIDYLNFGAYPEAATNQHVRLDIHQYITTDVIEKVLLRDLPSLYGIDDTRELNSLFGMLAFNTAQEVSPEGLSKHSGVSKMTLLRYIDYLENAFLVKRIYRVDRNATQFKRQTHFKIFLQNPSIYAALFGPLRSGDTNLGHLAETAVLSHWMQLDKTAKNTHYARWNGGEVDLVSLRQGAPQTQAAVEIKYSDLAVDDARIIAGALDFCANKKLDKLFVTTQSTRVDKTIKGIQVIFRPTSVCCLHWGKRIVEILNDKEDWSFPFQA